MYLSVSSLVSFPLCFFFLAFGYIEWFSIACVLLNASENNVFLFFTSQRENERKKKVVSRCALLMWHAVLDLVHKWSFNKDYRTGMWKKKLYEMSRVGGEEKKESPNVWCVGCCMLSWTYVLMLWLTWGKKLTKKVWVPFFFRNHW